MTEDQGDRGCRCARCGVTVDPYLSAMRVVDARVLRACGACAAFDDLTPPAPPPSPTPVASAASPARRRAAPLWWAGATAALAVAALGLYSLRDEPLRVQGIAAAAPVQVTMARPPTTILAVELGELRLVDPRSGEVTDDAIDDSEDHELYDQLQDWIHPLPDSAELAPDRSTRRFGAERPGSRRSECGAGHCGVDLSGPRGMPVVAVADGVVIRVDQRTERASGKYVKLRHADGALTEYMHLDEIHDPLRVGVVVRAGDRLGSLGRTGVVSSAPHLHFALEVPTSSGLRYVDPGPVLRRARVIDLLDMGVPIDPERAERAPGL
jgi:murein DD-endopeptidase MepM/ murein hydrolase activator NlpD